MDGPSDPQVQTPARALPYAGLMSTATEERVALVSLLRTLKKGERWASVTERVLEGGSALAIWEERIGGTLLPDPNLTEAYERAEADVRAWLSDRLRDGRHPG